MAKPTGIVPAEQVVEMFGLDLKNRALAALLAWLFPGAGHLYQGRTAKGLLMMICITSTFAFGFYLGDHDRLVIGGGVCDLSPELRERYRKTAEAAYHEHALDGFRNLDRLEFSVCGDNAPVIGALAWATP